MLSHTMLVLWCFISELELVHVFAALVAGKSHEKRESKYTSIPWYGYERLTWPTEVCMY